MPERCGDLEGAGAVAEGAGRDDRDVAAESVQVLGVRVERFGRDAVAFDEVVGERETGETAHGEDIDVARVQFGETEGAGWGFRIGRESLGRAALEFDVEDARDTLFVGGNGEGLVHRTPPPASTPVNGGASGHRFRSVMSSLPR